MTPPLSLPRIVNLELVGDLQKIDFRNKIVVRIYRINFESSRKYRVSTFLGNLKFHFIEFLRVVL
ncbi:hypothetical protein AR546_16095 [Leptospira interrogans serovar Canicola]|nr:hypothetical protein B2G47_01230 [Leptospira interrogans serovar Canicola]EKO71987.1 hypothetical protein LEP1GSC069_0904 [Leptospira interrogans serovar Canicola str. Fiocruz LV133]EMK22743.1 hypothetical protein LEP1GSC075_2926 [Leptospira interrogans str. Kito]EMN77289.1 hypothetical protein LEP1GSC102_2531 [Leptospira interrogans str. UI 09600]OQM27222.1 hypothetical protein DV30_20300 [Leptospira interrogans serovar Canicola str. Gui44]